MNAVDRHKDRQVCDAPVVPVVAGLILIAEKLYRGGVHINDEVLLISAFFKDSYGFILCEVNQIHDCRRCDSEGISLCELGELPLDLGKRHHPIVFALLFEPSEEAGKRRRAGYVRDAQSADKALVHAELFDVIEVGHAGRQ